MPVDGPPRMTSTTTTGTSALTASPMPSVISASPGPEVAVSDGTPANDAPTIMLIDASSSSACSSEPPTLASAGAIHSSSSVAGVIGYAATKRTPPRIAP